MSESDLREARDGEKGDENRKKDEDKVRNLIENQISKTMMQLGAMPSEKDVEQWGMEKNHYVEVCRAMVAIGTMCYEGREGDDLRDEDFFYKFVEDGSIVPFAGVTFKRAADTSAEGKEAAAEEIQTEDFEETEVSSQESMRSRGLSARRKERAETHSNIFRFQWATCANPCQKQQRRHWL